MNQIETTLLAERNSARFRIKELEAENERLRKLVEDIDHALRIPAAEYVPAIRDVFGLIDASTLRYEPVQQDENKESKP